MRTVLTISGVVIGIGAIAFLVSLGFGLQQMVVDKIGSMETLTTIEVQPKKAQLNDAAVSKFSAIKGVKYVSPSYQVSAQVDSKDKKKNDISVYGINPAYQKAEEVKADVGKELTSAGNNQVIASKAAVQVADLTEAKSIVGKKIQLNIFINKNGKLLKPTTSAQKPLVEVVGITKVDRSEAYVPIGLLKKLKLGNYYSIKVKAANREVLPQIKKQIQGMGFVANSTKDTIAEVGSIFKWVQMVLGGFGFIALFVASIGIFNTMTISLLERTHEIGVMKAVGATNKDIRRMFIFEAAQIGFWGGVFGVMAGWGLGLGLNVLVNVLAARFNGAAVSIFSTPVWFALLSIFFSLIVSLAAGIYPARRAGKLNPIEALRYE